ncbi:MAG TPA: ABC transporter permease, partial [Solirubrobacterales bacterium]
LQQWSATGLVALGETFVIIVGVFDLSVGGIFALAGTLAAGMAGDTPIPVIILAILGVGALAGVLNGIIVTVLRVNSLIATIATGQIFTGIALIYSGGSTVTILDPGDFGSIGNGKIGPVSTSGVVMICLYVVGGVLLARSIYGRKLYAVGGNASASRLAGLHNDRLVTSTYILCGMLAALGGFIYASRIGTGLATSGAGMEINAIIIVVLGGTAIGGGTGAVWRTAVGLGILVGLQNGFDALAIDPFYQSVIKGCVLILAVAWDQYLQRSKGSARGGVRRVVDDSPSMAAAGDRAP